MYKLHGIVVSNYYNMVKFSLLERGIDFEEIDISPSQEKSFLKISPRGMVPVLETGQGFVSETGAILDYLEAAEGSHFYPDDAFQQAKVKELMRVIELYIELPSRRLHDEVYFNTPVSDETKARAKDDLAKGLGALNRLTGFDPFLRGDRLSYADVYFLYTIDLAADCVQKIYARDILRKLPPAAAALFERLNARPAAARVARDRDAAMEAFLAAHS